MLPLPKGAVWQLLFLFCAVLYISGVRSDGRVVCYYTNWSVYRPGTAKFNPQNINPYLCTHLIYAFGGFTKDNQMKPFDKYQDIEQGGYAKFTGLKTYNKQLKTMIAIGGWNEASSRFSPLVANSERRQKFIKNILKFLRQNHFDGIDLDWEYPAHREGGKPRDRDNYAQFVQELRAEFERESEKTGRPRLLVTMAVPAGIEYIEKGYDIPKLNKYLDWFNVLTYDFHSSHEPSVNHHAPLYSLEEESEYNYDAELNIDYSIKFYLNAGADRDKLVLGIPTYGRSFTLINEESTEIGAPAEAPGEQGDATREKGYLAYYEICQNIKEDPEWTVVQPNPNAMGPYAFRRNQWVGYDDEAIVRKKAQYVVENGLGGIMFWAIDNDDFRGTCTGKAYPLIEAAKDAMLDALGLGINEVSKPSAPQKPSRPRSRENSSSTRNRITTAEHKLTYAERKGSSKRVQTSQQPTRSRQQSTTTSAPTSLRLTEAEGSSLYVGGRTTTPPPPTTPDPGTDFKCEDEGFFQHPRDCKKYYWCLDSGPSGLGIVAHQFTCPSGLYFNPAADSCDFARNVPCKTKKSTTAAPITFPASTTTTTARPTSSYSRVTAATSRATTFFRTTPRTTTTTSAPEEDIEYEEEEEENQPSPFAKPKGFDKDSEEDPKVIKELIELIRKVGGIEELEKHLLRKDDGTISIKENSSSSSSSLTATTPSSISKSLYEKVLSKPNALNSFRNRFTSTSSFRTTKTQVKAQEKSEEEDDDTHGTDSKSSGALAGLSKYSSVLRGNSRQGPQSEGIDKLSEFEGFLKEKKQYITINRNRHNKQTFDDEEGDDVSSKSSTESQEYDEEEVEIDAKSTRKPATASSPAYSTIRRTRPTTTTEAIQEEEQEEKEVAERKSYSSLNRSRVKVITTTEVPAVTEASVGSTRYRYLERARPTRPTTEPSNKVADEDDETDDIQSENQENTVHVNENTRETQQEITTNTQRTYASIGRRTTTSTTVLPETETSTSAAKTMTTTSTPTISTKETPLTTPLTILETTTPEYIIITTNIPTSTPTNPITTSTTATSITKTTTTTLPNGEDVLKSFTTTPNPNEINSDVPEINKLTKRFDSLLTNSFISKSTSSPTTESGLDTNEQQKDSHLTTTKTTISSTKTATINDSDNLTKTEDSEQEEVNLVSKQRNKTLFNTRTRITTTTSPRTTTTTTYVDIETTPSPTITTNAKKTLGVRRQQILLNRSSQTKITSSATTTDIPTTSTTESVNNDFLGTVSSPRPFGFPKRRRPLGTAGITTTTATTEEISKPYDETLITKQKTTKLNAAANSQTKVSSHNTILSQTTTETSSQQDEIQPRESEVTVTEHPNSKDTKVEISNKHVLQQVKGIELNNNNLKHDINNVSLDNISYNAHNTTNNTFEHELNYNEKNEEHRDLYAKKSNSTEEADVKAEEKVKELGSADHVTTVNVIGINEKDSNFSKKQNELAKETGKYRGKSLENSVENNDSERNHVEDEDEGRGFKPYTTINRRRQQTKQSTGIGDEGIAVSDLEETQIFRTSEENGEKSLKSKLKYNSVNRSQTTKRINEEIDNNENENGENEDTLKSKLNYNSVNNISSFQKATSLDDDSDENSEEGITTSRLKYTEVNRGQGVQTVDEERKVSSSKATDNVETISYRDTTAGSGLRSNTDSKGKAESDEIESETTSSKHNGEGKPNSPQTKNTETAQTNTATERSSANTNKSYSTLHRNQHHSYLGADEDSHHMSTKSESDKKTYTTITRNKGSGSSTENIPYKAIVRDSTGVHLTEGEFSGFIKHGDNSDGTIAKERTYQSISRGGQILQNDDDEERRNEYLQINAMASLSLNEGAGNTGIQKEHVDEKEVISIEKDKNLKTQYEPITDTEQLDQNPNIFTEKSTTHHEDTAIVSITTTEESILTTFSSSTVNEISGSLEDETTTTSIPVESTTRRSLFKNRNTGDIIAKKTAAKVEHLNQESSFLTTTPDKVQEETPNQAARRRVVFRKRPTSTRNQETVRFGDENNQDSERKTTSSLSSYRRRVSGTKLPNKNDITEEKIQTSTGSSFQNAGKLYRKEQLNIGIKRGQEVATQKVDEVESTISTSAAGSVSEEITSNSESLNNSTTTFATKKRIFNSKAAEKATASNIETQRNESVDKNPKYNARKSQFAFGRGTPSTSIQTQNENEQNVENSKRVSNNQESSSITETANGRRRTVIRKRIQSPKTSEGVTVSGSQSTKFPAKIESNMESLQKQNTSVTANAQSSLKANTHNVLSRKNGFAKTRLSGTQTADYANEHVENSLNNSISSNSVSQYQSRKSLHTQNLINSRKPSYSGRRGTLNTRFQNKNHKTEEVEILEDGSKRIKTIYTETIDIGNNKVKTIKKTKIKTIIPQATEYEDEIDETSNAPITRRPLLNRGAVRFQSNDLSSLLALDLASKTYRKAGGEGNSFKSRRKFIRKPPIVKEEEFVEEFEEELAVTTAGPGATPEVAKFINKKERPLKTAVITTKDEQEDFDEDGDENEDEEAKNVVPTTKRTFNFKRPSGVIRPTTSATSIKDGSEQKLEYTTKRTLISKRPASSVKIATTTEKTSEEKSVTRKPFAFKRPTASVRAISTTDDIPETTLAQHETVKGTTSIPVAAISNTATETVNTELIPEPTTEQYIESTTEPVPADLLNTLKNHLPNVVKNFKIEMEDITKIEVADAIEMKNEITSAISSGQDISLPIYHRRKYYQYYKDSPITYIHPVTASSKTSADTNFKANIDVAKQIQKVFDISQEHKQSDQGLADDTIAKEQAQEINEELNHFLLKTPGSE